LRKKALDLNQTIPSGTESLEYCPCPETPFGSLRTG
jgi:hypothetical protein